MKCEEVRELIQMDLDHELGERERRILHEHLLVCRDCLSFQKRLTEVHLGLSSLPKVDPPYSLVDAIYPRLEALDKAAQAENKKNAKKRFGPRWIRFASIAAAIALIGLSFSQGMHLFFPRERTELDGALGSASTTEQAPETFFAPAARTDQPSAESDLGQDRRNPGEEPPNASAEPKGANEGDKEGKVDQRSINKDSSPRKGSASKRSAPPVNQKPNPSTSAREEDTSDSKVIDGQGKENKAPASPHGADPKEDQPPAQPGRNFQMQSEPPVTSEGDQPSLKAPPAAKEDQLLIWMEGGDAEEGSTNDGSKRSDDPNNDPSVISPSPEEKRIAYVFPHEVRFFDLTKGEKIGTLLCEKGIFLNFAWNDENRVTFEVYLDDGISSMLEYNLETKQSMHIQQEESSSQKQP